MFPLRSVPGIEVGRGSTMKDKYTFERELGLSVTMSPVGRGSAQRTDGSWIFHNPLPCTYGPYLSAVGNSKGTNAAEVKEWDRQMYVLAGEAYVRMMGAKAANEASTV